MKNGIVPLIGIMLVGTLGGITVYYSLVKWSYNNLVYQIKEVNTIDQLISSDPALMAFKINTLNDEKLFDESLSQFDRKRREIFNWRLLNSLGIIEESSAINDVSTILSTYLNDKDNFTGLLSESSLEFFVKFTHYLGNIPVNGVSETCELDLIRLDLAANCLAGTPNSAGRFEDALSISCDSLGEMNSSVPKYIYFFPHVLAKKLWGNKLDHNQVLAMIFAHAHVDERFLDIPEFIDTKGNSLTPIQEYTQVKEFSQYYLLEIMDSPEVVSAKNWVVVFEGPEQLVMYVLFVIALLVLVGLTIIKAQGNDHTLNENQRLPELRKLRFRNTYNWIITAVPGIGFIGTIRGLGQALGNSDAIIRAVSEVEQSSAIIKVTEVLGIAFTTTLIALLLVLMLGLLDLFLGATREEQKDK